MKKSSRSFSIVAVATAVLFTSGVAYAATFKAEVRVAANDAGVVTITGGEVIDKLVQYCPDEWVRGCANNITVKREGSSFELDREGLADHQVAFNFIDAKGKWLLIPNVKVTCSANVTCETEKGYFTYTGAAAKK